MDREVMHLLFFNGAIILIIIVALALVFIMDKRSSVVRGSDILTKVEKDRYARPENEGEIANKRIKDAVNESVA